MYMIIVADLKAPPSRLHLTTGLVCCDHIQSGRATSLYRWLCMYWDTRTTKASQSQVSLKPVSSSVPKSGVACTTDLRVTCECLDGVSSSLCVTFVNSSTYSNELCFQVGCVSLSRVTQERRTTPVSVSRSLIGRGENCKAYRKSLRDPRPLIFGCTTSIKLQIFEDQGATLASQSRDWPRYLVSFR